MHAGVWAARKLPCRIAKGQMQRLTSSPFAMLQHGQGRVAAAAPRSRRAVPAATCAPDPALLPAGPDAILRVLDPRPPSAASWSRLPHVRVSLRGAAGSSSPTASALWWVQHAGWMGSAVVCAAAAAAHAAWEATAPPPLQAALHAAACMAGLVLACALPTDLCGVSGSSAGGSAACPTFKFFCGNLGLLLASATGAWARLSGSRQAVREARQPRARPLPSPPVPLPWAACTPAPPAQPLPRRALTRWKCWSGRPPSL